MSENYKPQKGDRVRVVLEGDVTFSGNLCFELARTQIIGTDRASFVSVEKIEPPVEVFEPGTIVRHLETGEIYMLSFWGFTKHSNGEHVRLGRSPRFTSDKYERVNL